MPSVLDVLLEGVFDGEDPYNPRRVQIFDGQPGQPTEDELVFDAPPTKSLSDVPPQNGHTLVVATRDSTFVEAGFRVVRGETILWDGGHEVIVKGVPYVYKRDFTIALRLGWFVYRHVWEAMEAEARRHTESKGERARLLSTLRAFADKPVRTAWQRLLEGDGL